MPIFSAASRVSRRHTIRTTQENGTTKHLSSGADKTAAQQYDGLRRGKHFYTIKEVVSTGLCSRQTLWRLMRSGELGYVKIATRPHPMR